MKKYPASVAVSAQRSDTRLVARKLLTLSALYALFFAGLTLYLNR